MFGQFISVLFLCLLSALVGGVVGRVSGFRRVRARAVVSLSTLVSVAVLVVVLLDARILQII
jgi:hypothetical protein